MHFDADLVDVALPEVEPLAFTLGGVTFTCVDAPPPGRVAGLIGEFGKREALPVMIDFLADVVTDRAGFEQLVLSNSDRQFPMRLVHTFNWVCREYGRQIRPDTPPVDRARLETVAKWGEVG